MDLNNKKIVFLGDSITEGWGASSPDKAYHQLIKNEYNLSLACEAGIGGSRIAKQKNPTLFSVRQDLYFGLRADYMPKDVDMVIVFGGTNDFGHGDAAFGDINSYDDYTFIGALNNLIIKLKNLYPNKEIIFMTPLHRLYEDISLNNSGKLLIDYVNAIIDATKRHDVKLIDLFNELELEPNDPNLLPDGLHPNDEGHKMMAEFIGKKLSEM